MSKRYTPKGRKWKPQPVPRPQQSQPSERSGQTRPGRRGKLLGVTAWAILFLLYLSLAASCYIQRLF